MVDHDDARSDIGSHGVDHVAEGVVGGHDDGERLTQEVGQALGRRPVEQFESADVIDQRAIVVDDEQECRGVAGYTSLGESADGVLDARRVGEYHVPGRHHAARGVLVVVEQRAQFGALLLRQGVEQMIALLVVEFAQRVHGLIGFHLGQQHGGRARIVAGEQVRRDAVGQHLERVGGVLDIDVLQELLSLGVTEVGEQFGHLGGAEHLEPAVGFGELHRATTALG